MIKKVDVSIVVSLSEGIEGLWVVCVFNIVNTALITRGRGVVSSVEKW